MRQHKTRRARDSHKNGTTNTVSLQERKMSARNNARQLARATAAGAAQQCSRPKLKSCTNGSIVAAWGGEPDIVFPILATVSKDTRGDKHVRNNAWQRARVPTIQAATAHFIT